MTIDYTSYECEKCHHQGVCQDGMDIFIALLCQPCCDALWQEYVQAVRGDACQVIEEKENRNE